MKATEQLESGIRPHKLFDRLKSSKVARVVSGVAAAAAASLALQQSSEAQQYPPLEPLPNQPLRPNGTKVLGSGQALLARVNSHTFEFNSGGADLSTGPSDDTFSARYRAVTGSASNRVTLQEINPIARDAFSSDPNIHEGTIARFYDPDGRVRHSLGECIGGFRNETGDIRFPDTRLEGDATNFGYYFGQEEPLQKYSFNPWSQ